MAITVTKGLSELQSLFNSVDEIYYKSTELASTNLSTALTVDMEWPVLSDGVTFDTGEPDITEIQLTTGAIWTSHAVRGDSDISFQVATISKDVNELFLDKKADISDNENLIDGVTLEGGAYSLSPKKVFGSLIMLSEEKRAAIILPNVEMYTNFVAADGENPSYFNVSVTPRENSESADIFILTSKEVGE